MGTALLAAGCGGPLSTLDPAGRGAEQIAELFRWMAGGAVIVWVVVIGLAVYAIRVHPHAHTSRSAALFIIGGGTVVPTLVLAAYLVYGLPLIPKLLAPAPEGSLQIYVTGEQWWWRVRYLRDDGEVVELANEIRLPVGEPVEIRLESLDVIHSFWIPALGGKVDMIPGRVNRLRLEPTRTGTFRGVCAEYCGTSHALMHFDAVVVTRAEFDAWLEQQAAPAAPADGQAVFLAHGCGACHAVRGTPADGAVGPDLTHVGSRLSIGAGTLPSEPDAFHRWLSATDHVKPGVQMPAFDMLPAADLRALASYLEGLQ